MNYLGLFYVLMTLICYYWIIKILKEVLKLTHRNSNQIVVDESSAKVYITGDKHRNFDQLIEFCKKNHLRKKDVIIILGDAGLNYYGDSRDDLLKEKLARLNVTLFCIHGNKEKRPQNISTYGVQTFCNGTVYYEPRYPNLFFAIDGEIYRFHGKEYMVIGGAHSVDRIQCLKENLPFWNDEMPGADTRDLVAKKLSDRTYQIDGFLTHTCPFSYLPTEMFISTKRSMGDEKKSLQREGYPLDIDRSTEHWLEDIMRTTEFCIWYCGHYHVDKKIGKIRMMYREITPLGSDREEPI